MSVGNFFLKIIGGLLNKLTTISINKFFQAKCSQLGIRYFQNSDHAEERIRGIGKNKKVRGVKILT